MPVKQNRVPDGENPIAYLLANGWTEPQLAVAWELRSAETVRKLRSFNHVPRLRTAARMAQTFGWRSAGEVIDFWAANVRTK